MGTRSAWTRERRARQAEIIRCTKPWLRSTGPRTAAGKAKSSQNAMIFRHDPAQRSAYFAMQMLIKNPCSAIAPALWAEIEAWTGAIDWERIDADIGSASADDEVFGL
jgi:hypothetical protein